MAFHVCSEAALTNKPLLPKRGCSKGMPQAHASILKILRILWRIQTCLKNTEKFLTPDLTSGSDLG